METLSEALGRLARERRKHLGMTLDQIAGQTQQTKSALSLLERGRNGWTVSRLVGVADALRVDAGRFLTKAIAGTREEKAPKASPPQPNRRRP